MDTILIKKYIPLFLLALVIGCATAKAIQRGSIQQKNLHDGIFKGEDSKFPVKAEVEVEIKNSKILSVNILNHRTMRGKEAEKVIPGRIVQAQSTDVDAVSGATASSLVIMNAAQRAIDKAAETGH